MADLPQPAGAQQVAAAIARPQAAGASVRDQHDHDSTADHGPRPHIGRLCPQLLVDTAEAGSDIFDKQARRRRRGDLAERRDDASAGIIAALVTAGAVGHRPQPDLRPVEDRILVPLAHRADMGSRGRAVTELMVDRGHGS